MSLKGVDHKSAFWWFVTERHRIWERRSKGWPEPWTLDPVLAGYHFTNVHRYKDPGTRFIVAYLNEHELLSSRTDTLFAIYAYRGLNRQETFERYGLPTRDPLDLARWMASMERARSEGASLGSGRHLTYWARLRVALPVLARSRDTADAVWAATDVATVVRVMSRARLDVGPFFGTQICGDLVTAAPRGLTMTRDVWPPVSGGSLYGLRLTAGTHSDFDLERRAYDERSSYGRKHRVLKDQPEDRAAFEALLYDQHPDLPERLTPIDLEHVLCEYARYARLTSGDMTRAKYLLRS